MLLGLLLSGCSAAADGGADAPRAENGSVVGGDGDGEGAQDESVGSDGSTGSSGEARLVVQTGTVWVEADDPIATARDLVAYVEGAGGRVDSRSESAASETQVAVSSLTVRVPADKVSATTEKLKELGRVTRMDLQAEDVTAAAQDLDARIHALELSVERMEALMTAATSTKELLEAEAELSSRQAALESLQSERARLQGRVSLSTLEVTISGPGTLQAESEESSGTFLSGLEAGWDALVTTISVTLVVLGAVLPWLLVVGLVGLAVLAVRRRRRRSAAAPPEAPQPVPVAAARPSDPYASPPG